MDKIIAEALDKVGGEKQPIIFPAQTDNIFVRGFIFVNLIFNNIQVRLEKRATHPTSRLARANLGGCPHGHGAGPRVTRESRMMEERNAVVSRAAKMMIETGLEKEHEEAHAMAQYGYVKRLVKASNKRVDLLIHKGEFKSNHYFAAWLGQ